MIKSMTGYGKDEAVSDGRRISIEVRSVNNRYLDYALHMPKYLQPFESRIRQKASEYLSRGKVDIFINIDTYENSDREILLNRGLAESYLAALRELRDQFGLSDDISVSAVARYSDIFISQRKEEDEESLWQQVEPVLIKALEGIAAMRLREGERLYTDLKARIAYLKSLAEQIDCRAPEICEEYRTKLYDKIREMVSEADISEARVLTEVAILSEKIAINEELVRLASHFEEYDKILESDAPVGRRIDFVLQETNREVNTIGSKNSDLEITRLVVEMKSELEKMREQIQNVE